MIKKISLLILITIISTSCVSTKKYKELADKYTHLKDENKNLLNENSGLLQAKNISLKELSKVQTAYQNALEDKKHLQSNYNNLKASYRALETNSSVSIAENAKKNRALLSQLEEKEQALVIENARLKKLKEELEKRSYRVTELEKVISDKETAMLTLKNAISKALTDFEGKGLTVEQRNGKVYVSMENKLLFNSGSWTVGTEGQKAVEKLSNVLGNNPNIAILIEGHTDNDPYKGNNQLNSNWDLSTKRATAIVNILIKNTAIKPKNLTAAGRGEYAPLASNDSDEGKAKNRRIEVILTPKLDQLSKLLNN